MGKRFYTKDISSLLSRVYVGKLGESNVLNIGKTRICPIWNTCSCYIFPSCPDAVKFHRARLTELSS